jgi:MarR family transcriptional regulator, transcriptional regulator for hemolysin
MVTRSDAEIRADLSYLFDKASQALAARMADALVEVDMTPRDYCVLSKAAPGQLTQGELAECALLDKTTMVVTLDNLESAGLARRVPSPTDRRARIVETTEAGDALLDRSDGIIRGVYDDVLGVLPPEQREVFLDALVRLVRADGPLGGVEPTPNAPRRRSGKSSRTV